MPTTHDTYLESIKGMKKKSSQDMSTDIFNSQVQQANQSAMIGNQQAYVLNERLKKYVNQINSGYGQRGLTQGDAININNQYQNSLGQVRANKDASIESAYMGLINRDYAQKFSQEQTASERAYQDEVAQRQFQNQQSLIDQAWQREQNAKSDEERRAAQLEIRDSALGLMPSVINSMPKGANVESAFNQFVTKYNRYIGRLSEADMSFLRVQFEIMFNSR